MSYTSPTYDLSHSYYLSDIWLDKESIRVAIVMLHDG